MSRSLSEMLPTWTPRNKIELTRSVVEPVLTGLSFKPVDAKRLLFEYFSSGL